MEKAIPKTEIQSEQAFPWHSLGAALLFILLTPFISGWLVLIPLGIELYRMLNYDEHVFMTDVVFLLPFSAIFMIPGVGTALGILIVLGDILYIFRKRYFDLDEPLMALLCLVLYLILRMQREITTAVFMATGMVFLYLMLDSVKPEGALRVVKGLLLGLLIASFYGMIFRGMPQIVYYISKDAAASMEYQNVHRFSGLMADPNYYSVYLILGMVLLLQMYVLRAISLAKYVAAMGAISFFGVQTYSRTFFVMFLFGIIFTIYFLFKAKKYGVGLTLSAAVLVVSMLVLAGKISAFDVILSRFASAKTLSDLTTGRSTLFMRYWNYITAGLKGLLAGFGLSAGMLGNRGTHNLYVEILYYMGLVGLVLFGVYFICLLLRMLRKQEREQGKKLRILSMLPILFLLGTYLSLQGIKASAIYIQFFVAYCAMILPSRKTQEEQNLKQS